MDIPDEFKPTVTNLVGVVVLRRTHWIISSPPLASTCDAFG